MAKLGEETLLRGAGQQVCFPGQKGPMKESGTPKKGPGPGELQEGRAEDSMWWEVPDGEDT